MEPFKVIVAGTRTFNDYDLLCRKLDKILSGKENVEIVSGGASGADALGERYAAERGHGLRIFQADWSKHGKAAGPIRNYIMAEYADALVVFWDGTSPGSRSMIELAREAEKSIRIIYY